MGVPQDATRRGSGGTEETLESNSSTTSSSLSGLYNLIETLDQVHEDDKCVVAEYIRQDFACGNTRSVYYKKIATGTIMFHNRAVSFLSDTNDTHGLTGQQQFIGSGLETTLSVDGFHQFVGKKANGTIDLLRVTMIDGERRYFKPTVKSIHLLKQLLKRGRN